MLLLAQLLKRKPESYKNNYGHIFAIGGSPGLTGALCLCAQAGLRIGAGLVTVGIPRSLNSIYEVKLTEVMSLPLSQTKCSTLSLRAYPSINEFSQRVDVLAIGCGASRNLSTQRLILKIIKEIDKIQVIDADGINALAGQLESLKARKSSFIILTPHWGEFLRLINKDVTKNDRKLLAKEFAYRYNLLLVLKGHRTIVTDGKKLWENTTGNPGMATAGSGDVLTGIISGLAAQGLSIWDSATLGVYLHGLAGDLAAKDKTVLSLVASDIINYLPLAIKKAAKKN